MNITYVNFAYYSQSQAVPLNVFYPINFTIPGVNNTNFNASSFTIPFSGVYYFNTLISIQFGNSGTTSIGIEIGYYINGTEVYLPYQNSYTTTPNPIFIYTIPFYCYRSVGDVVSVQVFIVASSVTATITTQSFFFGSKIG